MADEVPFPVEYTDNARFRGAFPPFPEGVTTDELREAAQSRGIDVTGKETKKKLIELLLADAERGLLGGADDAAVSRR